MDSPWRDIWRFGGAGLALVNGLVVMPELVDAFGKGKDAIEAATTVSRGALISMIVGLIAFTTSFFWR